MDWILGTGQNRTHMIYVSDDEQQIITTNVSSGTVSIIEMETVHMPDLRPAGEASPAGGHGAHHMAARLPRKDWNQTVVRVGNGSEGFDVSPDRREYGWPMRRTAPFQLSTSPGKRSARR